MVDYKEIESLIKLLDDPDPQISQPVEDRLLSYGYEIVDYLESAWEQSFDAILQERIENLVHKIQFSNVKTELELWNLGGSFDLLRGVIAVNKYQYPDLNEQKIINQIEEIKREIWLQMTYEMSAVEKVKLINHVFYTVNGFSGNTTHHQDPQNSFIGKVLETKKGNQILLATIYSVIAQKLDIPIYGVNLPQHFVLAYVDESPGNNFDSEILFYINAFNGGLIFSRRDVDSFLKKLSLKPDKHFYEPCSNEDIVKRIIRNLISSYEKLGSVDKVEELKELLQIFYKEE